MAADEDRKGIAGAKKASKAAVGVPAKPAASAARGRGRPRKAATPQPAVEEPKAATPVPAPVSAPVSTPPVASVPEPLPTPVASEPTPAASESPGGEEEAVPAIEAAPPVEPAAEVAPVDEPEPAAPVVAMEEELPEPAPVIAQGGPEAEVEGMTTATDTSDKTPPVANVFAGLFTPFKIEDKMMDMSPNFSGFQDAMTEAQAKAKAAFEKSTSMLGEVSDFTKGNVEAMMESGKIFAEGMQGIGSELVTEGRSAFETMTGDIKELAAVKSPTDFFKIQGEMMRKNFDSAVAYGSKNSEAMLKLMSDAMAPISGRVSMAMEKARSVSV